MSYSCLARRLTARALWSDIGVYGYLGFRVGMHLDAARLKLRPPTRCYPLPVTAPFKQYGSHLGRREQALLEEWVSVQGHGMPRPCTWRCPPSSFCHTYPPSPQ